MLYVEVPEPVKLVNLINDLPMREKISDKEEREIPPISMCSFLMRYVVHEVDSQGQLKIGKGYVGTIRVETLYEAFKKAKTGELVAVDQIDWDVVNEILESLPLHPMVMPQLGRFFRAWRHPRKSNVLKTA